MQRTIIAIFAIVFSSMLVISHISRTIAEEKKSGKTDSVKKTKQKNSWLDNFRKDLKEEQKLLQMAEKVVPRVTSIRGLKYKGRVWTKIVSREEVIRYIYGMFQEQMPPETARGQDLLLKKLGLIPQKCDTASLVKDLLNKQVAGFYDPKSKTFFLIRGLGGQEIIAAHELTHTLQDHNFDLLGKFKLINKNNSDETAARMSLIEGDATLLMAEYARQYMNPAKLLEEQATPDALKSLKTAPRFLVQTLTFPYIGGMNFCGAIMSSGNWQKINRAYDNPPNSTEQILHPDKFIGERDEPTPVEECDISGTLGKDYKMAYNDVMGEFGIRQILLEFLDVMEDEDDEYMANGPKGWDGDRIALFRNDKIGHSVISWKTVWDSEKDAQEFFSCIKYYYTKRFPKILHLKPNNPNACLMQNGSEIISITLGKRNVWVVDGVKDLSIVDKIKRKTTFFEPTTKFVK